MLKIHKNSSEIFNCAQSLKPLYCNDCSFSTQLRTFLALHKEKIHSKLEKNDKKVIKSYVCRRCNSFTSNSLLTRYRHFYVGCKLHKIRTKRNLQLTLSAHSRSNEKWYDCDKCAFRVQGLPFIIEHIAVAHNNEEQWFNCPHCPFKTTLERSLRRHIPTKHSSEKWFQCGLCNFGTTQEANLKQHFDIQHECNRKKWVQCKMCPFKTKLDSVLCKHRKMAHQV